ncbi:MAG: hypothetical protein ACRC8Y_21515 [Chroococcales cyanobacterium]
MDKGFWGRTPKGQSPAAIAGGGSPLNQQQRVKSTRDKLGTVTPT